MDHDRAVGGFEILDLPGASYLASEINFHDLGIVEHHVRRSFGDLGAEIENDEALAERGHQIMSWSIRQTPMPSFGKPEDQFRQFRRSRFR